MWKPTLGRVSLDVEFADRTIADVVCTPLQATVLIRFAEQRRWHLQVLAGVCMYVCILRPYIMYR